MIGPKFRNVYSREEEFIIIMMRKRGEDYRHIAMILERPYKSVADKAAKLGVGIGSKGGNHKVDITPLMIGWIRKRLSLGWDMEGIAIVLNIPKNELEKRFRGHPRMTSRSVRYTPCMIDMRKIRVCYESRCYLHEKCPVYRGSEKPHSVNYRIAGEE